MAVQVVHGGYHAPYDEATAGYKPAVVDLFSQKARADHYADTDIPHRFGPQARSAKDTVRYQYSGGQAGWQIPRGGYTGMWAALGVFEGQGTPNTRYSAPSYVSFPNDQWYLLYAPTMKPPDFGCFEVGVQYDNVDYFPNTQARLMKADWCQRATQDSNGQWHTSRSYVTIDDNFFQNYVRVFTNGNGYPEVEVEEDYESDGQWHVLIYDENPIGFVLPNGTVDTNAQKYIDSALTSGGWDHGPSGNYPGLVDTLPQGQGWSQFETQYGGGSNPASFSYWAQCASEPTISQSGLRTRVGNIGGAGTPGWSYANVNYAPPGGDCFPTQAFPYYYFDSHPETDRTWFVETNQTKSPAYKANDTTGGWVSPTPTPRPIKTPNPCLKDPRLCEAPVRTPTPDPKHT